MTVSLDAAIKKYTEQLAVDPKSRSFVPLSDAYRQLGQYEEAISVAKEGLKNHPTYVTGKITLARAYFENGDVELAFEILDEVLSVSPDNLLANRIFAEVCIQKGDSNRAIHSLKAILQMEPSDDRAQKRLTSLESKNTKTDSPPSQAKEPSPTKTATLAEIYLTQGHLKEAAQVYEDISQKDPAGKTKATQMSSTIHRFEKLLNLIQERRKSV